jgi:hypothetical protein
LAEVLTEAEYQEALRAERELYERNVQIQEDSHLARNQQNLFVGGTHRHRTVGSIAYGK